MPALVIDERIHDTATINGTGDYVLLGAPTGKQPASVIGASNYSLLFITDDINWEVGIYTYLTGPGRLQRTAIVKSSNGGSAVNWNNANVKIKSGLPAWLAAPRMVSKSVAGSSNVALTAIEQTCNMLELTGAIGANINVTVDTTKWVWIVENSTTGNFEITFKTAAGSGVKIPRGMTMLVWCDGVNVLSAEAGLYEKTTVASAATPDIWTNTGPLIDYTGTATATSFAAAPHAGARRVLLCAGACTFQNGANLAVPGAANYTAAAGDVVTVHAVTLTTFRIEVTRANGTATVSASDTARIDVASAATVSLTASAPNTRHINITGTTTITGFTVAAGLCYFVRFSDSLTLTNNAGIITQTGANIVTQAGDTCILRATAANTVEVLAYVPAILNQQTTRSMVRLHTSNGYGSTNTVIRRFSTTVTNQGADITYADSATLGATFTINAAGVYALSYSDNFNSAADMGLSLNSSQLTTSIISITAADRLAAMSTAGVSFTGLAAWIGYLPSGSVIRPHGNGQATSVAALAQFTITRIA